MAFVIRGLKVAIKRRKVGFARAVCSTDPHKMRQYPSFSVLLKRRKKWRLHPNKKFFHAEQFGPFFLNFHAMVYAPHKNTNELFLRFFFNCIFLDEFFIANLKSVRTRVSLTHIPIPTVYK